MKNVMYYIASASSNRNDYVPHIHKLIQDGVDGTELVLDWPKMANLFQESKDAGEFKDKDDEDIARKSIRNMEIQAILNSDIMIVALPGGNGTHFEYGFATGISLMTSVRPRIVVYAPSASFIQGDLGHFVGLDGTVVIVGDEKKLVDAVSKIKSEINSKRLSISGVIQ